MLKKVLIGAGVVVVIVIATPLILLWSTKRHSPSDTVTYTKDGLEISIEYCRPSKKDRVIFGGLVPYGEVWRTGANEATTFEINRPALIGGKRIEPGKYGLFTIPEEDHWTLVLNTTWDQWGAFGYDPDADVLRVDMPVTALDSTVEQFTIEFSSAETGTELQLKWDITQASVSIEPEITEP